MASRISPYSLPSPIRSSLLKNAPETVPPTDELEQLQSDLKLLKLKTLERAKKAGEDLKVIQESMRQMKEREKGKFKAIDKVKRERDCTYFYFCVLTNLNFGFTSRYSYHGMSSHTFT